jgi:CheY-like chemotaxis protein
MNSRPGSNINASSLPGCLPGDGIRPFVVSPPLDRWRPSRAVAPVAHPPRKTVLVVDDEPMIRLLYRAILYHAGLRVLDTGDGHEALRLIPRHRPDVIVSDLSRPGLSADEFIIEVRRLYPGLPILVFSGLASPKLAREILALGARSCVRKPFEPRVLLARIRRALLARSRAHRARPARLPGTRRPTCRSCPFRRFPHR